VTFLRIWALQLPGGRSLARYQNIVGIPFSASSPHPTPLTRRTVILWVLYSVSFQGEKKRGERESLHTKHARARRMWGKHTHLVCHANMGERGGDARGGAGAESKGYCSPWRDCVVSRGDDVKSALGANGEARPPVCWHVCVCVRKVSHTSACVRSRVNGVNTHRHKRGLSKKGYTYVLAAFVVCWGGGGIK
jgi:hypothetical protein